MDGGCHATMCKCCHTLSPVRRVTHITFIVYQPPQPIRPRRCWTGVSGTHTRIDSHTHTHTPNVRTEIIMQLFLITSHTHSAPSFHAARLPHITRSVQCQRQCPRFHALARASIKCIRVRHHLDSYISSTDERTYMQKTRTLVGRFIITIDKHAHRSHALAESCAAACSGFRHSHARTHRTYFAQTLGGMVCMSSHACAFGLIIAHRVRQR